MARCPSCNKFASYDDPESNDTSAEVNDTTLNITVEGELKSQCCGDTVKTASLEYSVELPEYHTCPNADLIGRVVNGETVEDTYEADEPEVEGYSRSQTHDRHGNPIKNPRYARTYYGFTGNVHVKHLPCDEEFDIEITEGNLEEQASSWEEAY